MVSQLQMNFLNDFSQQLYAQKRAENARKRHEHARSRHENARKRRGNARKLPEPPAPGNARKLREDSVSMKIVYVCVLSRAIGAARA